MDKVPEEEIARRLATLDGWRREGNAIIKTFELKDFTRAVGFVVEIVASSHDAGTVTKRDLDLATKIEELLQD
jgi:pterin-4a-carbinolamine dehydratase